MKKILILLLLFTIGIFLRFYNLNWGSPFYFHPDERQNIAYPILASKSLFMMDQQNFDTGTFPLIVIKIILTCLTYTFHTLLQLDQFSLVILISRIISAIISVVILVLLFFIVKKIFTPSKAYLTLIFATFSVGLIQFSHFGTIELWEALFFLIIFFYTWRISKYTHKTDGIACGILFGFAVATKILSIILLPTILLSILKNRKKILLVSIFFICSASGIFSLSSLPLITNFSPAINSTQYESSVALGKVSVFYTQGFISTIPVIFQFTKIYPFLLNPLMTLLFLPSLASVIFLGIKQKNYAYILLVVNFLFLFLTQAFFFVKWTRYMIPTLPFMYIIIGIALDDWLHVLNNKTKIRNQESGIRKKIISPALFVFIPVATSIVYALSFLITAYFHNPTPIEASKFAANLLPQNARIITEPYDLGITPFNQSFPNITFFSFYDLDDKNDPVSTPTQLSKMLTYTDYIILPSQRILTSRLNNRKIFPLGYNFYSKLLNGTLGFRKIYETPCDIFCKITYLGNPAFAYEETANVFDRPEIFIFQKKQFFDENTYTSMIEQKN